MDEFLRVINENGITKIYYYSDKESELMYVHELKHGESVRINTSDNGKLASINEKRL